MTNLQQNSPALSPQLLRRLWFGVPAAAFGLLSLLAAGALLLPLWNALQRDTQRLQQLEGLETQVSLMRQQLRSQNIQEEKALEQKDKLIRMISGSGDTSTMLAVLDREARLAGVRLDLWEPQAAPAPPGTPGAPAPAPAAPQGQAAPPPNPLELAGLQPQGMVISLHGSYPQLLGFLRRLESLNVLVIQSDLKLEAPPANSDRSKPPSREVTMRLSLTLYGRTAAAQVPPPPAPAPAPGAAAPAPGAAAAPAGATPAQPGQSPAPATPPATAAPAPAATP